MKALLISALVFFWGAALAQSFGNLDFEKGRVPRDLTEPSFVTPEQAAILLPDWEPFTNPAWPPFPYMIYDTICVGSPCIDVSDSLNAIAPIQGRLTLGAAFSGIRQTAMIPTDARSVVLKSHGDDPGIWKVGVNSNPLNSVPIGKTGDITTFAADVSAWSGQVSELSFLTRTFYARLDDISFSAVIVVPEPSTWALFGLGLAPLAWSIGRRPRPSRSGCHPRAPGR